MIMIMCLQIVRQKAHDFSRVDEWMTLNIGILFVFFESQQLSAMLDLWTCVYFVSVTGDVSADTTDQYSEIQKQRY